VECGTYDIWENAPTILVKKLEQNMPLEKPASSWDESGKRIFQQHDRADWTELL
jgi:hypothetical protein